jgi:ABC-2 type transport system ATP-binding protein
MEQPHELEPLILPGPISAPLQVPSERPLRPASRIEDPIIHAVGLGKKFVVHTRAGRIRRTTTNITAVDAIDLSIYAGESVGFIGPNGAGKSTTIKMITGVLTPSTGTIRVLGIDPLKERMTLTRRIGVVFGQRSQLWWDLPLADSFGLLRHLFRVNEADHHASMAWLTELLDLGSFLQTPVRQLSLGQRMRGELAAALAHRPELLILDEPTIGLDLVSKDAVRTALRQLNETHGTTVLLTTHDLADIAEVCRRVVVINHGTIVEDGPLPVLIARLGSERIVMVELTETHEPLCIPGTLHMRTEGRRQWLRINETETTAGAVIAAIGQHATVVDLSLSEPDFDDVVRRVYGVTS